MTTKINTNEHESSVEQAVEQTRHANTQPSGARKVSKRFRHATGVTAGVSLGALMSAHVLSPVAIGIAVAIAVFTISALVITEQYGNAPKHELTSVIGAGLLAFAAVTAVGFLPAAVAGVVAWEVFQLTMILYTLYGLDVFWLRA